MSPTTLSGLNWMEGIDRSTPISKLSIPGSHESCSRYAKQPMRLKPDGELWCGTEGKLVNVTFVAA